jgi:integrase
VTESRRRRGQGEGTLSQRADGRWEAKVSLGYAGGKRRRKTFYGPSRAAVAQQLARFRLDQEQGLREPASKLTVGGWFGHWLATTVARNPRPNTRSSYAQATRTHILPELGRIGSRKLEPRDVEAWFASRLALGLAPATVRRLHAVLHIGLEHAVRQGYLVRNVAGLVQRAQVEQPDIRPLDRSEALRLLEAAAEGRDGALVALALTTGLRQGELFGLRWADVDLAGGTLEVRQQYARGEFAPLKRSSSRRRLHLPQWLRDTLRAQRTRLKEEQLSAGQHWQEHDLVFPTSWGTPRRRGNSFRAWKKLLAAAGVRDIRFHDLRHSAATLALGEGANLFDVSRMLGHKSIATTSNQYGHWTQEGREDVAERLGRALRREA